MHPRFIPKLIGIFLLFSSVFLPFYYKEQVEPYLDSTVLLSLPVWEILATFAWLFGGWFCFIVVSRIVIDFWLHRWHPKVAPALTRSLIFVLFVLIVLSGILSTVFDKPITGLWAMSGGISLILGIALQSIIADFFAGIILNAEGTFKVGDHIQVNNIRLHPIGLLRGRVIDINWHSTRIRTPEGDLIIFPNNMFNTTVVTNLSAPGAERAFEVLLSFDYGESIERITRILEAAALSTQELLRLPLPKILVGRSNGLQQEYRVEVWFSQGRVREKDARSALMTHIHHHIQHSGIIPAPLITNTPAPAFLPPRPPQLTVLEKRVRQLRQTELFGKLSQGDLEIISANLKERTFRKGELVVRQGAAGDSMFLVIEGLVQVKVNIQEQSSDLALAELQPGEYFGEMSLFSGENRIADIECLTSSILFEITKETLQYLLEKNPLLSQRLVVAIARRQSELIIQQDRNREELKRLKEQVVQSTFRKVRNYFSDFIDSLFMITHHHDKSISAASVSHMGLLAAQIGIESHQELALNSVILGIGIPKPPIYKENNSENEHKENSGRV